jgi:hypothetical protein
MVGDILNVRTKFARPSFPVTSPKRGVCDCLCTLGAAALAGLASVCFKQVEFSHAKYEVFGRSSRNAKRNEKAWRLFDGS